MGWSQALLGGARKGWEAANNPKEMQGTKFIIIRALKHRQGALRDCGSSQILQRAGHPRGQSARSEDGLALIWLLSWVSPLSNHS